MKKQMLTETEFKVLGFSELIGDKLDSGDYYRWWEFRKSESNIIITYEYNYKDEFINGYVEFNGEILKGREITIKDITFLIEIM